jgi:hypothetical protein
VTRRIGGGWRGIGTFNDAPTATRAIAAAWAIYYMAALHDLVARLWDERCEPS